ncbi:MAG: calcium/sodium antiporter [Defluviitaleaceae bacterium]|nr:calcium/sodium antiporter [Defluviitaleaceae bacterium]
MSTALEILGLIIGFVMLIKGADIFVDASVNIAKRLKVPSVVIGLTIVAMGTSAPEVVIGIVASAGGSSDMAVGNVLGSNIFNLMFIIGLCAIIKPLALRFKEFAKDYWLSIAIPIGLLITMFLLEDYIPRIGGVILVLIFLTYMTLLVRQAMKNRTTDEGEPEGPPIHLGKSITLGLLGLVLIIIGAQFAVTCAEGLAQTLGITERVIGITVIAVGTSLPELVIFLISSKKGENEMAAGVIIGSNIFNILFVLGISGIVMPLAIDGSIKIDLAVLIAGKLAFLLFALTNKKITRLEGLVFVLMYVGYIGFIIL